MTLRIRRRLPTLLLMLASWVCLGASCGGGAGGGSGSNDSAGKYECVVLMIGPKLSDSGAITGGAQVECTEPPMSHHAGLYLEYHSASGTSWLLENADKSSEIRVFAVIAHCRVGDWRLRYQASGEDATGKPFNVDQQNKVVFIHTCPH